MSNGGGRQRQTHSDVQRSLRDYVRGLGGGLLVGLPLLFTMEMWQHGAELAPLKLLVLLGAGALIVAGYQTVSGFRTEVTPIDRLIDSIESVGLGILAALVALVVLGRVTPDSSLANAAGQVALEAIPVAFGISVARTQLAGAGAEGEEQDERDRATIGPFGRLFVAAGGAVLFALNVAPTEEIVLLASEMPALLVVVAMAVTYLFTLAVVFYAEFGGRAHRVAADRPLASPLGETLAAYAISLGVSLALLWAFARTDGASAVTIAKQVAILGVVASFGAAAGRLLLTGEGNGGGGE